MVGADHAAPPAAGGAALAAAALVRGTARRALAVASRFALAAAGATLYLHTAELFPSAVAAHGVGLASLAGRLGATLAPWLAYLGVRLRSPLVPLLVAGAACCAAAAVAALLPETLGAPQQQTIAELNEVAAASGRRRPWAAVSLPAVFRRENGGGGAGGSFKNNV